MSAGPVRTPLLWLLGLACSLVLGCAASLAQVPAPAPAVAAAAGIEHDLQAGRSFVLVVSDAADRKRKGSEAYGDAQAYLRSFIERRSGGLPVHHATPEQATRLLAKWPRGLRQATLFAHPQGQGLLHRGLVLEPQIYLIGRAFAEDGSVSPEAASYGMEPFAWK